MREPLSNIGLVCPEHGPKPGKYMGQAPESFIGKYVKLGFPTPQGKPEHMWVLVHKLHTEGDEELEGELNNDPIYVTDYKCGDLVAFNVSEIEAIEGG